MSNKTIALVSILALTASFAVGRYSVSQPPAVTKVDDIKKDIIKDVDSDKHKETTTVIEKDPDGKTKTTTTVTEDTTTKKHVDTTIEKHEDLTITPTIRDTLNVSALIGADFRQKDPVYGVSVTKQFLGPVTIGIFGLTNYTVGLSVGLNF